MKRILLVCVLFFAFAVCALCQVPPQPIQPQPINFVPLINLDGFFDGVREWFSDVLKHFWVILLTLFLAYLSFFCVKMMLSLNKADVESLECEQLVEDQVDGKEGLEDNGDGY